MTIHDQRIAVFGAILIILCSLAGCSYPAQKKYTWKETEVCYENTEDHIHLSGTLTMPDAGEPVPAVLLIQGSGPLDRDETIGRHQIFKVMAHHLAENGIAVLRTDKRGCGRSGGDYIFCDIENFAEDAFAGVNFLKTRKGVDPGKTGLIGHSLGGLIASTMAAQSSEIQFIVSMASTGVWGREVLYDQNLLWAESSGVPESEIDTIKILCDRIYDLIMMDTAGIKEEQEFIGIYHRLSGYLDEELRMAFYPPPADYVYHHMRKPEFRGSFQIDPRDAWSQVRCPVLLIWGSLDHNVSEKNHRIIQKSLVKGGNPDVKYVILRNHNHHFQSCRTGRPSEVQAIDQAISHVTLITMTEWIIDQTRQARVHSGGFPEPQPIHRSYPVHYLFSGRTAGSRSRQPLEGPGIR